MNHLADLLRTASFKAPASSGIRYIKGDSYVLKGWKEVWEETLQVAQVLWQQGAQPKTKIALLSENRPEWLMVDMAAYCLNAVTVPIYMTSAPEEIRHVLVDSEARIFVVSNASLLEPLEKILSELKQISVIIVMDDSTGNPGKNIPQKTLSLGSHIKPAGKDIRSLVDSNIDGDHASRLATIIYTSGTTGEPKGVMLSHGNFLSNVKAVAEAIRLNDHDVHLSFLPLCHVFERVCGYYLPLYRNATIAYAESNDTVMKNILQTRPTFLLAVPRFYEKVCKAIQNKIEGSSSHRKKIFGWAMAIGKRVSDCKYLGKPISLREKMFGLLADILVYRKIRHQLGGRLKYCVSGGAALSEDLARMLYSLNILVIEGYGLTETSPVIAANRLNRFKFGTVGLPLDGIEVRIAEDGEILTKSSSVMQGYYHQPAATQEVMKDGWFCTGDIGELDREGFLSITGRKKEMIVTSSGKMVCTEKVESIFENEPAITRCILFGEGKSFLTALIVPDFGILKSGKKEEIVETIKQALDNAHKKLAPYQQIKYFHVLEEDLSVEHGELTPTLKLKRRAFQKFFDEYLKPYYEKHGQAS